MFQDIRNHKKSLSEILPKKVSATKPVAISIARPHRSPSPATVRVFIIVAVLVLFSIVIYTIGSLFSSVSVEITPRQEILTFDNKQVQIPDFKIATFPSLVDSRNLIASGIEEVEQKASGQIVIYNNFNTSPQTLITGTRFESTAGNIYRINKEVVVPGQTTISGQIVPGQVEVTVYADNPGENYNSPLTDFSIPGFKDSPRYEKFYARSKTPMTGGYVGSIPKVADDDKRSSRAELEQILREQALGQLVTQIPDTFIWSADSLSVDFSEQLQVNEGEDNSVTLTVSALPRVIIFDRNQFTVHLINGEIPDFQDLKYFISNLSDLDITINNKEQVTESSESITLTVSGQAYIQAEVDTIALSQLLAGNSKRQGESISQQFPAIYSAKAIFWPPWLRYFPSQSEDIEIKVLTHPEASANISS